MRAALAGLALVACGPPEIEGAVTFTSRHLVVHADPQYALCEGSLARADAFLEAVAGFLDVPVPRVEYNLYGGLHSACGLGFPGDCTLDGEIWSASWIHDHEMVHAVAAPVSYTHLRAHET